MWANRLALAVPTVWNKLQREVCLNMTCTRRQDWNSRSASFKTQLSCLLSSCLVKAIPRCAANAHIISGQSGQISSYRFSPSEAVSLTKCDVGLHQYLCLIFWHSGNNQVFYWFGDKATANMWAKLPHAPENMKLPRVLCFLSTKGFVVPLIERGFPPG